jgi:Uma2 family endonuclease
MEVAGSSLGYDRGLKARIYAKHGVREFWVIKADTRVTWIHTRPGVDGSWGSVEERPGDAVLSTHLLRGLSIRTADLD